LTPTGSQVHPDRDAATRTATAPNSPEIFMMDLLATVPYYTAYLSRALLSAGANVTVGSITYYLDTACYSSRGLRLQPGCLDIVGRYPLPRGPRPESDCT
jgi:hypothetical protein